MRTARVIALSLLIICVPAGAQYGALSAVGLDGIDSAVWMDGNGTEVVGITGKGVSIWSFQSYDSSLPDVTACDDGEHLAFHAGRPIPFAKGEGGGHGPFIAGIICGDGTLSDGRVRGIAPGAHVWALRAFDCVSGEICPNMSSWWTHPSLRIYTSSYQQDPLFFASSSGMPSALDVLIVHSVGNDGGTGGSTETHPWTNQDERHIGVAALTFDGAHVASYSSRGARDNETTWPTLAAAGCMMSPVPLPWVDYYANGYLHQRFQDSGTDQGCPTLSNEEYEELLASHHAMARGTSFSTPAVAAVLALMFELHPHMSSQDAKYLLTRTADRFLPAVDLDGDGAVSHEEFRAQHGYQVGWGRLNASRALAAAHYLMLTPSAMLDEAVDCSWYDPSSRRLNPGWPACGPVVQPEPVVAPAIPDAVERADDGPVDPDDAKGEEPASPSSQEKPAEHPPTRDRRAPGWLPIVALGAALAAWKTRGRSPGS